MYASVRRSVRGLIAGLTSARCRCWRNEHRCRSRRFLPAAYPFSRCSCTPQKSYNCGCNSRNRNSRSDGLGEVRAAVRKHCKRNDWNNPFHQRSHRARCKKTSPSRHYPPLQELPSRSSTFLRIPSRTHEYNERVCRIC